MSNNTYNNGLSTTNEQILFTSINYPINNVIIIDPNKVVDKNTNKAVDRSIRQEDLVLYANLRVVKKPSTQVYFDGAENKSTIVNENEINILMLNPIKSIDKNGGIIYKNNFTVDYTDYFTTNSLSNLNTNNIDSNNFNGLRNYFDPETFGITNITISQNAQFKPTVTIEFTDVQGKTLFESGDHPNNPYNLFYSFPYPTFILSIKGFYGKTVDLPLVLYKTTTKFDPESGSYKVTAEFLSRTFSIYNTFLLVYAYLAPKMFKREDGSFLGMDILKKIYDDQNSYYSSTLKTSDEKNRYIFNGVYPTMNDIETVTDKLTNLSFSDDVDIQSKLSIVNDIDSTMVVIKEKYDDLTSKYTDGNDLDYFKNSLEALNTQINNISDVTVKESIFKVCKDVNNSKFFDSQSNTIKSNILESAANIAYYKQMLLAIIPVLENRSAELSKDIINRKTIKLKDMLGYIPNAFNISRIIFNNIQAFLILMNIALKKALGQIANNKDDYGVPRLPFQKLNGEYQEINGIKFYEPFPNYFISDPKINSKELNYKKTYPGYHSQNAGWAEVQFIDEIMNAIDALIYRGKEATQGDQEVFLMSPFDVKPDRNKPYNKNTSYSEGLSKMLERFQLTYAYNGYPFKNLTDTNVSYLVTMFAEAELKYYIDMVINQLDNKKIDYVSNFNAQINADDPYAKIISRLTANKTANELTKIKTEIRTNITKNGGEGIKEILKSYNIPFEKISSLYDNSSQLIDTTETSQINTTPIYSFDKYKSLNSSYFISPGVQSAFNESKDTLKRIYDGMDLKNDSYLFYNEQKKIITTGATATNNTISVNPYDYTSIIKDGESRYKTLTQTVSDTELINKLIGFDNSYSPNTNVKNKSLF